MSGQEACAALTFTCCRDVCRSEICLGAGSGSVSIEAARVAPLKGVFAVEKDSGRYSHLVENIKRFHCFEVRPVLGLAPEVLSRLPDPNRVFIRGGGSSLEELLGAVEQRLRPQGRVVQTAVSLDTIETARSFWRGKPFDVSVTQVQVNRSVPLGNSLRFEPLNPVFVFTACRRP